MLPDRSIRHHTPSSAADAPGRGHAARPRHLVRPITLAMVLLGAMACHQPRVSVQQSATGGDVTRGQQYLRAYGCGACHVIPGVRGANGLVGPPLTSFGDRSYIAGRLPNQPEHLVRWIMNPQSVDSLTAMPNVGVAEPAARDIAAYLYALGQGLGPSHLLPRSWLEAIRGG